MMPGTFKPATEGVGLIIDPEGLGRDKFGR